MGFASPIFLTVLPLSALPVLFHFLMKRREARLKFPSLMFFLQADPKMRAKRRLKELLLLASRIMLLLLLILALSGPSLKNVPGIGGNLAIAIVIDNSASMDGPASEESRKLPQAREAARSLIDALDEDARAVVIPLVPDPAVDISLELTSDKERLKDAIDDVRRTEAAGSTANAFSRTRDALQQAPRDTGRAVHFFSDLHEETWGREARGGDIFGEHTDVVFHRIGGIGRTGANVAVEAVNTPGRPLLPRHNYNIDVILRNTSDAHAEVRVNYEDSQDEVSSFRKSLGPGLAEAVQFAFTPEEPGNHWAMISLEGDNFRGDNRAAAGFICTVEAQVHFIGEKDSYGLMPRIISPTGTGYFTSLRPSFVSPAGLLHSEDETGEAPATLPSMVVTTWQHLSELPEEPADALKNYVNAGGRLFVVPDANRRGVPDSELPEWLRAYPVEYISMDEDEPDVARILDRESDIWSGIRGEDGRMPHHFFLLHRYKELSMDGSYSVLAGTGRRRPLLAERKMGDGRIYLSGFAFEPDWTPLVTDPSGLVVVALHNVAAAGTKIIEETKNILVKAGETLPIAPDSEHSVEIRSFIGDSINVSLPPRSLPVFPRAGVYGVNVGERSYMVSVRGAGSEAKESYITADRLAVMGENEHTVVAFTPGGDFARQLRGHFVGFSLFLPLSILLIFIWGGEAWLSSMHKKRGREVKHQEAAKLQNPQANFINAKETA